MGAAWEYDPWIWIGWFVVIGSLISGLVAFVIILILTEPRQHS